MLLDHFIAHFDRALRAVAGVTPAARPSPAEGVEDGTLHDAERRRSAALMRVNHSGEVCAQALYEGQSLASRDPGIRAALARAAQEEADHLAWSARRIEQLGGRPSLLNPLWYAGSLGIGFAAGRFGDAWNLGFLAETERQVERHLDGHLERLSPEDHKSRAVLEAMRDEEAGHARTAQSLGAYELPSPVRRGMQFASRVMTGVSYWI